jgi:thiosulfate/3-mercaptopyruvate sulfurtransferase
MKRFLSLIPIAALAFAAVEMALVQPDELAKALSTKPAIFQVGPNVLYRSKHIPGAIFAGPGQKAEGIALLKAEVAKLPKDREIAIYCGCCPWDKCPNMQPAFAALKEMGYTKVKALYIPENFKTNWIDKGHPVE